jgi:hypothetical protein
MWPSEARHPAFIASLKEQYDYAQLEAIEAREYETAAFYSIHST